MFGQVLDKLNSWLGLAFLLSRFMPCLLFAVVNLLIGCIDSPRLRGFVATEYAGAASSKAVDIVVFLLVVAVFAYAISPVVQFISRWLEGSGLPRWIEDPLLRLQARERDDLQARAATLAGRRVRFPTTKDVEERLKRCRAAGRKLEAIGAPDLIVRAEDLIKGIRELRSRNQSADPDTFNATVTALAEALRGNCAEPSFVKCRDDAPAGQYRLDVERSRKLDALHREMWETLTPYVIDIAERTEASQWEERSRRFAETALAPTRIGNDVAELRSYCETRYELQFDFFWPRLQLAIQKNEKLSTALANAKMQVDFSVLSLALTVATVMIWLCVLLAVGQSLWTLLAIVAVMPPLAWSLMGLVHASYSAFSELARSAIDISRLDLLQQLHMPLPPTADAEKQLWKALARWLMLNEPGVDLDFSHPKS